MKTPTTSLITRGELLALVLSAMLFGLFLFIDGGSASAAVEEKAASSQTSSSVPSSTVQTVLACATPAQACQSTEVSK